MAHVAEPVGDCSQSLWESADKRSRFSESGLRVRVGLLLIMENSPGMLLIMNGDTKVGLIPNTRVLNASNLA